MVRECLDISPTNIFIFDCLSSQVMTVSMKVISVLIFCFPAGKRLGRLWLKPYVCKYHLLLCITGRSSYQATQLKLLHLWVL